MARQNDIYSPAPQGKRGSSTGSRVLVALLVLAVVSGVGYWGYTALAGDEGEGDPEVTAAAAQLEKFIGAWETGDAKAAASFTDTPSNAESLITSVTKNLEPSKTEITPGDGEKKTSGDVQFPFNVAMRIPGAADYMWDSRARVLKKDGAWLVEFTTPMIHPKMEAGQTLALQSQERASVLDVNGDELRAASVVGAVDPKTGKGISGLEARYDKQLSGGAGGAKSVVVVDRNSGQVVKRLTKKSGAKREPVRTTIDPTVQEAAADALEGVSKNAAIVAIDPSTGNILAAANKPGGQNRALSGQYPPGSTFKVVTTAALLKQGMRPDDAAECPKFAYVDGQRFENQDQFVLPGGSTFRDSFAHSCNTFFVNSAGKLSESSLNETSKAFGIGGSWDVGVTTYDGSVPVANGVNDKAASTIGQARVLASPLVMASLAATVKAGEFRQPVLVPDAVKKKYEATAALDPGVTSALREMMRATVTEGAGKALQGVAGEPHAKTGTAEFGNDTPLRTHAWMIGYQGEGNVAWSVLLEDGGSGGADAGPIAAKFLKNLG
ncbi:PbsX family transcriptional regulator [Streptomyces finlayi]|uniref:PbsX family transcriptional regulator n=1 Tax=Streptomyces finlayi TaxID=67296 RepID=A0A7G7BN94_9ACTN|nr:penicillin-binding transpeptidase domain-containing protein [Streptomyces finlayi]QNE76809.1 PbsX family transcriptional regulator [Streptomyces finlayi]